ncbi:hypothetical protein ACSBR1_037484 [Camellia fascicularis]
MIVAANGPQLFPYKKLSKATRNFSKDNLLRTGGFGSVYKSVMSKPPTTIAVKKNQCHIQTRTWIVVVKI